MVYRALALAVTLLLLPPDRATARPAPRTAALAGAPVVHPTAQVLHPTAQVLHPTAQVLRPTGVLRPAAVPRPAAPVESAATGYGWPVAGQPVVTRGFSPPPRPWLPGHRGVDLAGTPGEVIRSAGPGVVAFAGTVAGTGVVSVDHPDGLRTTYEPVAPLVRPGQPVASGQAIATLLGGHPGCPVAACLHWGLRRGAEYLDPLLLLHAAPVRLYPAGDQPASRPGSTSARWS